MCLLFTFCVVSLSIYQTPDFNSISLGYTDWIKILVARWMIHVVHNALLLEQIFTDELAKKSEGIRVKTRV